MTTYYHLTKKDSNAYLTGVLSTAVTMKLTNLGPDRIIVLYHTSAIDDPNGGGVISKQVELDADRSAILNCHGVQVKYHSPPVNDTYGFLELYEQR